MNVIVPNRLKELTLGQYQHFQKLEGDEDFLGRKMVEIFCDIKMAVSYTHLTLPTKRIV